MSDLSAGLHGLDALVSFRATAKLHGFERVHVARVDFLFPDHGVVVEVSGSRGHSSAADRAKDARRRNELQRLGRLVLEFTYEDLMNRRPYVLQTLREALRTPSVSRSAGMCRLSATWTRGWWWRSGWGGGRRWGPG